MEATVSTPEQAQAPPFAPDGARRPGAGGRAIVRVSRKFRASPERVFDAWFDPDIAGRWLFATASQPVRSVSIDARVGGAFRFVDADDGERIEHAGVYIEIVRPRRLAFTLSLEHDRRAITRVRAEFVALRSAGPGAGFAGNTRAASAGRRQGAGSFAGCRLTLVHEAVPAEYARRMEGRWTGMLYGLGAMLEPRS